ncbi:hypothetical protein SAMN03080615_03366 [Amphritea atlantica]|uniref:NAD dependent epimerase/dehydratase family protein n=1 Tax=Amphritea atlantica TaxID=355243 RepID=A0A1H9K8I0_9GAMM|nr:hypothetical protein SAMN03080615_03366 [Amphritea atlantica]
MNRVCLLGSTGFIGRSLSFYFNQIGVDNFFFEMENQPPFDMSQLRFKDSNVLRQGINRAFLQFVVHLSG